MSDFEEAAEDLYRGPPAEFVAARDEKVRAARAAGDREMAKQLGALRRPTQGAWAVNQLWRERRKQMDQLLEVGNELRAAAQNLSGDRLRELSRRRHDLIQGLVRQARVVGDRGGVPLDAAAAAEVESTLGAAVADPEVADQVRSGRLLKAAEYAGFGPDVRLLESLTSRGTAAKSGRRSAVSASKAREAGASGREARAAKPVETATPSDDRRAERLRAKVKAARSAADDARAAQAAAMRLADTAELEVEELEQRRDELHNQLRDVDDRLSAALRARRRAESERLRTERALAQAGRALDDAERALAEATTS